MNRVHKCALIGSFAIIALVGCESAENKNDSGGQEFDPVDAEFPKPTGQLFKYRFNPELESAPFNPETVFTRLSSSGIKKFQAWYQPYMSSCVSIGPGGIAAGR